MWSFCSTIFEGFTDWMTQFLSLYCIFALMWGPGSSELGVVDAPLDARDAHSSFISCSPGFEGEDGVIPVGGLQRSSDSYDLMSRYRQRWRAALHKYQPDTSGCFAQKRQLAGCMFVQSAAALTSAGECHCSRSRGEYDTAKTINNEATCKSSAEERGERGSRAINRNLAESWVQLRGQRPVRDSGRALHAGRRAWEMWHESEVTPLRPQSSRGLSHLIRGWRLLGPADCFCIRNQERVPVRQPFCFF